MTANIDRDLRAIKEKIELLTGERSEGSRRAVLLSEWNGLIQNLADQNAVIQKKLTELSSQMGDSSANLTQELLTLTSETTALAQTVTTLKSALAGSVAEIQDTRRAVSLGDMALAENIQQLSSSIGGNTAQIAEEKRTRATADDALAQSISTLSATVSSNNSTLTAAIQNEQTARANGDAANATAITTLTATATSNNNALTAAIQDEQTARANGDAANATAITTLTATATSNNNALTAAIQDEQTARANGDAANATAITTLTAAIQNEQTARANGDSANASSINSLSATVNGNSAAITTLQTATAAIDGALSVLWSVQGTIDGVTGGLRLTGLKKADGSGTAYNLIIDANTTINGNLLVNGTVKNQGLEDYAASNSGMSTGVKSSGNVGVKVRKNSRVACIASYSGNTNDTASNAFLKVTANGNTISRVPMTVSGKTFPLTTISVYPGNIGTRVQGNGQADASSYYQYSYQYIAYYYYINGTGPWPAYATATVTFPPTYAFDDNVTSLWLATKSGNTWIKYTYTQGVLVGAYKVMGYSSSAGNSTQGRAPKAWSLQASNDGTTWTTIDTRSNQTSWGDQEARQFTIDSPSTYTQYRMKITESVDAAETLVGVVELSFFLPGVVSDFDNVVFAAEVETTSAIVGYTSLYVVELSK